MMGAIITGGFSYFSHQRDLDAKMIELSVGILRADPKPETEPLREWAINVINKRAGFQFNAQQRAILLKKPLPFKGGYNLGAYDTGTFGTRLGYGFTGISPDVKPKR